MPKGFLLSIIKIEMVTVSMFMMPILVTDLKGTEIRCREFMGVFLLGDV